MSFDLILFSVCVIVRGNALRYPERYAPAP